ncbi:terpenoid synthase [Viridothelium virens]|uniref:Terpene synthase n=1 Tax=Viridothelium virens TaxID=1048519 RepID=A0A6A6GSH9_VIRVR|nr:terpenoid synthase [Viridothelium virens]
MNDSLPIDPETLCQRLSGQQVWLPDLEKTFERYPVAENVEVGRLREDVAKRLDFFFPSGKLSERLKAADIGGFGAVWWPYAPYEQLRICTYLMIWLFAWDDETDSLEYSDLSGDFERSKVFRAETIAYCRQCLGLLGPYEPPMPCSNPLITNFKDIGESLQQRLSYSRRLWLMDDIEHFVRIVETEQRMTLSKRLPSVREYMHRRMGTSAVNPCINLSDYAYGFDGFEMPRWVATDVEFQKMCTAVNVIISASNDIFSIKKEIKARQIDTLVPLLYVEHGCNIQEAVDAAAEVVRTAVADLDESSRKLLEIMPTDKELQAVLVRIVESCQFACTGNLNWTLSSGRYLLGSDVFGKPVTL